jgi:diguanylate cyclase (GGDEF)-like protein
MWLPVNDICGLILASLFGFLVGGLHRLRQRQATETVGELRRAHVIADELATIATELHKLVGSHQRRVAQFKERIKSNETDDLSTETERFLKPTMELTYQIGQAYERIRQQSTLLGSLHESRTDALTGVGNRRTFDETIESMFGLHARYKTAFSIALIDVDHFKQVNDTQDHLKGDKILARIGEILLEQARDTDVVTRYGGEEFVVLMPQTDLVAAAMAGERLRANIQSQIEVTVSIGISAAAEFLAAPDMMEAADKALYQAKEMGRNRVCIFDGGTIVDADVVKETTAETTADEDFVVEEA